MLAIDKIRDETPAALGMIHFNNAGASLMPQPVWQAMQDYLSLEQQIGGYEAARQQADIIDRFYHNFGRLLNTAPATIAFVENATRAWDMAVHALPLEAGDQLLVHESEYASNYLGLLNLARRRQIELVFVPSDKGVIDPTALEASITNKTKAIFLTHMPSQNGLINPAKEVGLIAQRHGLFYVLDICQSAGQMPVDVMDLGCDIACGTGRKFLRGPRGTGFLYVAARVLDQLHPPFIDLHSAQWSKTHDYALAPDAKRFECWERFMAGQIALSTAADYALAIGLDAIETRIKMLAGRLRQKLATLGDIKLHDLGSHHSGIVTFSHSQTSGTDLMTSLQKSGINISAIKSENTRLDIEKRALSNIARASVHYFNTDTEIDDFCAAVDRICNQ